MYVEGQTSCGEKRRRSIEALESLDQEGLTRFYDAYVVHLMEAAQRSASQTAQSLNKASFSCPDFSCSFTISIPDACARFPLEIGVRVCVSDLLSLSVSVDLCEETGIDDILADVCGVAQEFAEDQLDVELSTRATEVALQSLITQLEDSNTSTVAIGADLDTILGNSAIVQSAIDSQRDFIAQTDALLERLEFERRTLDSDSADGLLALPAVQGGRLEEVRAVVVRTIVDLVAAGQGVNPASVFLAKGEKDYGRRASARRG